ncbi:MAG TPA: alpha/beta hydrolase [Opitutaceae bacterium]
MTTLLTIVIVAAGTYAFLAFFAHCIADSVIFRPHESSYRDGGRITKIVADDGTPLTAIHLPVPKAVATVLYLHGNAEDIGDIIPHLEEMQRRGLAVVAFDYRGYGTTPGSPTERNVNADTRTVFRHLVENLGVASDEVLLYGRSLGSGPAIELATRETVCGLVLDGAFTSTYRVVTQISLLPGDRFRNIDRITRVKCPILFIHGTLDLVTPAFHGKSLYDLVRGPKRSLWVEGAGHSDVVEVAGEAYWQAIMEIARGLQPSPMPRP